MKGRHILLLFGVSFLLTNVVAYLDEGIRTFEYLTRLGDWIALVMYTTFFSLLPLVILYLSKGGVKRRFSLALLGFLPVVVLILNML